LFSPGDKVAIIETGYFSLSWAQMAKDLSLEVETIAADWRRGLDFAALRATLAADTTHSIKAVCAVHNETATGMVLPLKQVRAVMDEVGHPALLLSDTISSLGSLDFRMDEWGVDVAVGGSQKGLMLPTGMSFTGVSAKAMAAHKTSRLPKSYLSWTNMLTRKHNHLWARCRLPCSTACRKACACWKKKGLIRFSRAIHGLPKRCGVACVIGPAMPGRSFSALIRIVIRIA